MHQSAQTTHLAAFCNHAKVFAATGIFLPPGQSSKSKPYR